MYWKEKRLRSVRRAQRMGCSLTARRRLASDPSMPNHQNDDKKRENFNARHNCADKKDKFGGILGLQVHSLTCARSSRVRVSSPTINSSSFRRVWRKGFKAGG